MKKGSLELSMNSIVIIILAVVFVSLVLVFIQTVFQEQEQTLLTIVSDFPDIDPPTKDDPLKVNPKSVEINVGGEEFLDIKYFHPRDEEWCQLTIDKKNNDTNFNYTFFTSPQLMDFGKGMAAKVIVTTKEGIATGPKPSKFVKVCCVTANGNAAALQPAKTDGGCKASISLDGQALAVKEASVPVNFVVKR